MIGKVKNLQNMGPLRKKTELSSEGYFRNTLLLEPARGRSMLRLHIRPFRIPLSSSSITPSSALCHPPSVAAFPVSGPKTNWTTWMHKHKEAHGPSRTRVYTHTRTHIHTQPLGALPCPNGVRQSEPSHTGSSSMNHSGHIVSTHEHVYSNQQKCSVCVCVCVHVLPSWGSERIVPGWWSGHVWWGQPGYGSWRNGTARHPEMLTPCQGPTHTYTHTWTHIK